MTIGISGVLIAAEYPAANQETNQILVQAVAANNRGTALPRNGKINLGSSPENIYFYFGLNTNLNPPPVRIRYKLEGYDEGWQDNDVDLIGEMNLRVRFFDNREDLVGETLFSVTGESAGWTDSLKTSSLTHRRETLVVPSQASKLVVVISSAGPPETVGIYAVANLVVSESSSNSVPVVLLQFPFDHQAYGNNEATNENADGWVRDGIRPSMAKIVQLGKESDTEALAILDDSVKAHAEWHNEIAESPKVTPGDHLVIEWNEMYSIGMGNTRVAIYKKLPTGNFHFRVEAADIMGNPTGAELLLAVHVPPPFWKTIWFWGSIGISCLAMAIASGRYVTLARMRREMAKLEKQRMLEQERTRIARDIHDDLGARATQISLVSGMARSKLINIEQAGKAFDEISEMSRDLISALYETVWAVNPENDNLNELGNYLFLMVKQFCDRAQCRCRFHTSLLPREVAIPSQIRHSICLAVKEAVHNAVKHAKATEITIRITFTDLILMILIQDDGCGFDVTDSSAGHGLSNLERRLTYIGGTCAVKSQPDHGTTVDIRLAIKQEGLMP